METPFVGETVHYVSYGTPGGEFTSECRAAVVTEVNYHDPDVVGLCVLNPSGLFFHSLSNGGCRVDAMPDDQTYWSKEHPPKGGSWHRREGCLR